MSRKGTHTTSGIRQIRTDFEVGHVPRLPNVLRRRSRRAARLSSRVISSCKGFGYRTVSSWVKCSGQRGRDLDLGLLGGDGSGPTRWP